MKTKVQVIHNSPRNYVLAIYIVCITIITFRYSAIAAATYL